MRSGVMACLRRSTAALAFGAALIAMTAQVVEAQEAGAIGLAIRAPQSVGVIVNVTDTFALVPSVDIAWSWSRSEFSEPIAGVPTIEHSQTGASLTLAARLRLAGSGDTAIYVSPSYSRSLTSGSDGIFANATAKNDYAVAGHIGVQHALNDRFSVFGEVGARFRQYKISTDAGLGSISETTTYKTVNTSSAIGAIYYFKR